MTSSCISKEITATVQRRLIKRTHRSLSFQSADTNDSGLFQETTDQDIPCSYLRPLFSFKVKGVSNHPVLGLLNAPLHKLLINILLDICSGSGTAALPLVEEEGKVGLIHGPVH